MKINRPLFFVRVALVKLAVIWPHLKVRGDRERGRLPWWRRGDRGTVSQRAASQGAIETPFTFITSMLKSHLTRRNRKEIRLQRHSIWQEELLSKVKEIIIIVPKSLCVSSLSAQKHFVCHAGPEAYPNVSKVFPFLDWKLLSQSHLDEAFKDAKRISVSLSQSKCMTLHTNRQHYSDSSESCINQVLLRRFSVSLRCHI